MHKKQQTSQTNKYYQMGLAQSMGFKPTLPPQYQHKQYTLMTYRSNIIPVQNTTYYTTDAGWGCMLRVAQMFIANLLVNQQYHVSNHAIIKLFYDNLMVPFSIQMITKVSAQMFPEMKKYSWYTPCQAGFIVKDLLQRFDTRYKVVICNDGAMFLEDILNADIQNGQNNCQLKDKQNNKFQQTNHIKDKQQKDTQQQPSLKQETQKNNQKSLISTQKHQQKQQPNQNKLQSQYQHPYLQTRIVVLLMARIGLDSPQPGYVKCITKFMENKYFVSIMGGTPKYAHLFLQYYNGYFGFLDPHTTRPVVQYTAKVNEYIDQYTAKLMWVSEKKIDSSMCVGFSFFKSQIKQFWEQMLRLKQQLKQDFFIYMDEFKPQFDQNAIIQIGGYSDQEDEGQQQQQQQEQQ